MNSSRIGIVVLTALAMLAGCSSTPVEQPPAAKPVAAAPAPQPAPMPAAATPSTPQPVAASTVKTVSLPAYLDPKSPISNDRSVYFAYDSYTVTSDYAPLIERHGKYLSSNPALSIKVEGNCDERGSSEYNLALGQRRAQAVVQTLKIYGVRDSQVEPVSWGEERPKATGHDEAAWAQNRRADHVYPRQ